MHIGQKIYNIKASVGATIGWIYCWSVLAIIILLALLFGGEKQQSKEDLTYIEGFYQGRKPGRGFTIVLMDGEKYKIGVTVCDNAFDERNFCENVKSGDLLQMLVDLNTKYYMPYIYELESNDISYITYEDAIKFVKKNNREVTIFAWIAFSIMTIFSIAGAIKLIVDGLYKKKQISTDSSKVTEKYSINANVIRATVAGTVYKIMVVPGQEVRKGDTVLIIKSMQMQIPVLAPDDAIVENVYVSIGDILQKDMMVVLLR